MKTETITIIRDWHDNGQLAGEEYRRAGKLHRTDGPAWRRWHPNGLLAGELHYIDGELLSRAEWEARVTKDRSAT